MSRVPNSGRPATSNGSTPTTEKRPDGQYTDHWVDDEPSEFIRPVRTKYIHNKCGSLTSMPQLIAETYAKNPKFYGRTFCCMCGDYFNVEEFRWDGSSEVVGS